MTSRKSMKWHRVRFNANYDDCRPVRVEPPGPWWCTGSAGDGSYSTIVAYFPEGMLHLLTQYWPEATEVNWHRIDDAPVFSDRFPKPDDWVAESCQWAGGRTVAPE